MLIEHKDHFEANGTVGFIESVYESDNILKTTYFPLMQRLYIAFSRGGTYSYGNITPEFYSEFEKAESHGTFFHTRIKKFTKEYPFRKEFTLYPSEIKEIKQIIENKKTDTDE